LRAIPYIDPNPSRRPADQKWAIRAFTLFVVVNVVLIIVGTFFRGPGWALADQRTDSNLLLERAADPQRRLWTGVVRGKELYRLPQCRRRGSKERAGPVIYPGSIMPAYDLETNARKAIIAFMASATTEDAQSILSQRGRSLKVPSLLHASDDYTKEEVIKIIQNGKAPPVDNTAKPAPPLYMPSWKGVLADEDIHRIADYLWSLQKKKEGW
jgi:hypothetical protein